MGGTRVAYPLQATAGGHKEMLSILDIHASQSQCAANFLSFAQLAKRKV